MPRMLTADSTVLNFSDRGDAVLKLTNASDLEVTYKVLCSSSAIRTTPIGIVEKKGSLELRFTKDPAVKLPSDIRLEVMWKGILFKDDASWPEGGAGHCYGLEGVVFTVKAS
ncbi:hypothetical protein PRIPAC_84657 [Pristionchus pacificus]|uniref:Uncharacterized protein n=1 Tax=Pristionchus pacificus TaxID=54126 RepID=A0A454XM60_PRIPA|nr:hypothetical protein PRIPAC_84657 [Pristionchus pacificus]|eukprot:PDM69402.1 hypothetical protein PRIPAC_44498 [Pristionchus pacificus]